LRPVVTLAWIGVGGRPMLIVPSWGVPVVGGPAVIPTIWSPGST
jgi:hypothetical protein